MNRKGENFMNRSLQIVTTTLSAACVLLAAPTRAQGPLDICDHVWPEQPFVVSERKQTVQLNELGIEIQIPDNYRTLVSSAEVADVMSAPEYDYVQCMIENQVPTVPDVIAISFVKGDLLSEQQLVEQMESHANSRFGIKRMLGETQVAEQQAFVYIEQGIDKTLTVRVNYPNRDASLAISTYVNQEDEVVLEQQLTEILSSLTFL